MTLISELIDVPLVVNEGDFVLKLTSGVEDEHAAQTIGQYVVTDGLVTAFDEALGLIGSAFAYQVILPFITDWLVKLTLADGAVEMLVTMQNAYSTAFTFLLMFGLVAVSGYRVVQLSGPQTRDWIVVTLAIVLGYLVALNAEYATFLSDEVIMVLQFPVSTGGLLAILIDLVIPKQAGDAGASD